MKLKSLLLIIFSLTFIELTSSTNQDIIHFDKTFNEIILGLDSLINQSKTQNDIVKTHYKFVLDKIYNGTLPVVYDSTLTNEFYGCCGFNVLNDSKKSVNLSFGKFIVEKYHKYPYLIYAILISTFQNAYDYYNNTELFLISAKNKIERTYFQIDAMTVEALFLKNYVIDKSKLGTVEKYLIADLDQYLNGSAILFSRVDLTLLHKIDEFKSSNKNQKILLADLLNLGNDLKNQIVFTNSNKWNDYCSIITLNTYAEYGPQVIYDIVNSKNPIDLTSFKLDDYPDNLKIINDIKKIVSDNKEALKYYDETMQLFARSYKD